MSSAAKSQVRRQLAAGRAALSQEARAQAREAICAQVLERVRTEGWTCVAAYVPLRTEPGSLDLLTGLARLGVRVLVPVTLADRDLDWREWSPPASASASASADYAGQTGAAGIGAATMSTGAIGLADAVLVPAFAVAPDRTRLGRGGGSYDRALPRRRPGVPAIAVLFDGEVRPSLPRDAWDQPVDEAVTPSGWVRLVDAAMLEPRDGRNTAADSAG